MLPFAHYPFSFQQSDVAKSFLHHLACVKKTVPAPSQPYREHIASSPGGGSHEELGVSWEFPSFAIKQDPAQEMASQGSTIKKKKKRIEKQTLHSPFLSGFK